MNEAEWATWNDPETLLDYLRGPNSRLNRPIVATDRKLILWACACCRRIGHLFDDSRCFSAILAAERFADDGSMTYKDIWAIGEDIWKWANNTHAQAGVESVRSIVARACSHLLEGGDTAFDNGETALLPCAHDATRWAVAAVDCNAGAAASQREKIAQCSILRDLLGNPFRPVQRHASWLTPPVTALADQTYSDRCFSRLPELAAALIEAGCADDDVLGHCRSEELHVRGCWVVDLILGMG